MTDQLESVTTAVRHALDVSGVQVTNAVAVKVATAALAAAESTSRPNAGLAEANRRFGAK